jgi:hypothetical protein
MRNSEFSFCEKVCVDTGSTIVAAAATTITNNIEKVIDE